MPARALALATLVAAGVGGFYWVARPHVLAFSDAAVYVASAQALAAGRGYVLPMYPGEPPNTYFPPGYSLVLATIWRVAPTFPANLTALQLLSLALTAAFLALSAVVLARSYRLPPLTIALAVALASTTLIALQLSTALGSDTLYGVLSLAAILCVGTGEHRPRRLLLGGVCAVAAYYTRTVGLSLILALALVGFRQLRRGDRLRGACLMWPAAATLPWLVWTSLQGGAGYVAQWRAGVPGYFPPVADPGAFLSVVATNALRGHDVFWNVAPALIDLPLLSPLLMAWVLLCAWQRWRRTGDSVFCYLGLYVLILLAWPWHVPGRFLWPVAPLVAADALVGLQALWRLVNRRWARGLRHGYLVAVAFVLAFNAAVLGTAALRLRAEGWVGGPVPLSVYEAMLSTATYLDTHVAPSAVLGTNRWDTAAWWWLYTERQALDSIARADGQGAFFRGGQPAGDAALVDYFIYQVDNGVPGADDGPAVEAQLVARGVARTPVFCAGDATICVYDWRSGGASGDP
jgi:hypothetical protein